MHPRDRRRLDELSTDGDGPPAPNPKSGGGNEVDSLFNGARGDLLQAQEKLSKLVKHLQANSLADIAPPVADCLKATIDSVATMDKMAKKWQEAAEKARQKNQQPGSLNTGVTNLTTGRARSGFSLMECIAVVRAAEAQPEFDGRSYVKDRLFFEKPLTLEQLQRETVFDFGKFMPDAEDDR